LWDNIFGLSGSVVGSWIFQTLGAPEAGWGGTGIAAFRGGPHDHAPAQDLARAGRARLGTVSAREAGVAMFANKTRVLLTFREEAGSACSSGRSASGVKTQAGGSSIGSCRTTGKDQLASRQRLGPDDRSGGWDVHVPF